MERTIKLLSYNLRPIELMMANSIQTILNCNALAEHFEVELLLISKASEPVDSLEKITEDCSRINILWFKSRLFLYCHLISRMLFQDCVLYSRSTVFGIFFSILGRKTIVELHQDRLSSNKLLNYCLFYFLSKVELKRLELVVISDGLRRILCSKGLDRKLNVLHDGFDQSSAVPSVKQRKQRIVYTGMVSFDRGFADICAIAKECPDKLFVVIGADRRDVEVYRREAGKRGVSNLKVFVKQSRKRVAIYQCNAAVLLAIWGDNVPTMEYCSPLKLFEYMSVGRPILCHDYKVLAEVLPIDNEGVRLFKPGDIQRAVRCLRELSETREASVRARDLKDHVQQYSYEARALALASL